jgi:hypothetical protein
MNQQRMLYGINPNLNLSGPNINDYKFNNRNIDKGYRIPNFEPINHELNFKNPNINTNNAF